MQLVSLNADGWIPPILQLLVDPVCSSVRMEAREDYED